jgi:hypothetical protein
MSCNCPGFIDDKARFPRRLITLCIDGVCILIGAMLGTSPLTVVAESSVGIKEGGRTGGFQTAVLVEGCVGGDEDQHRLIELHLVVEVPGSGDHICRHRALAMHGAFCQA